MSRDRLRGGLEGAAASVHLDVDDDGVLEVLTSGALHVATPPGPDLFTLPEPYFVCGC